MTTEPGIARERCPFCGERPRLHFWDYLPRRTNGFVTCRACAKDCYVAAGINILALSVGGIGAVGLGAITITTLGPWTVLLSWLAFFVFGMTTMRLTMRLEPPGHGL